MRETLKNTTRNTNSKTAMAKEILDLRQQVDELKALVMQLANKNNDAVENQDQARIRVDRIQGQDNEYHKIERIRVNSNRVDGRDAYGNK